MLHLCAQAVSHARKACACGSVVGGSQAPEVALGRAHLATELKLPRLVDHLAEQHFRTDSFGACFLDAPGYEILDGGCAVAGAHAPGQGCPFIPGSSLQFGRHLMPAPWKRERGVSSILSFVHAGGGCAQVVTGNSDWFLEMGPAGGENATLTVLNMNVLLGDFLSVDVVRTFGAIVGGRAQSSPVWARRLLLAGWMAQLQKLRLAPDKRLPRSRQYASVVAMDKITKAMRHPENAAAMSLFCPYEPLEAAGILPYSVEQMSSFIAGTKCENAFLALSEDDGFCNTMCSYHRIFLGACADGMVPKPKFAAYTNLACDGNLITFPYLQRKFDIPGFCIDVPFERSEEAVADVSEQLRAFVDFVQDCTGRRITEDRLRESVARSYASAQCYRSFLEESPGRRLPSDMTCEMYAFLMSHVIMGSPETLRFCQMLAAEMRQAPKSDGLRLVWLHTMPFSQPAAIDRLNFNDGAYITACDLAADAMLIETDPSKPYEAMARRMVYSCMNGETQARIDRALQLADMTRADGAVLYCHWGCKATLGVSRLMKDALEERGLPCLLLDGDGADSANRSDGQTATRLDAFFEMLRARG